MKRLILFDVDGTLIERGDPAHIAALDACVLASFPTLGLSVRDIEIDGKVDRQILRDLVSAGGVPDVLDPGLVLAMTEAATRSYRAAWGGRLSDEDLLPGVRPLVERLHASDDFALGLLTGGIRGIVETKLNRLGLERYFPIGAFGDEVDERAALLPLALERARTHYRVPFEPENTLVIGDTPRDIDASHAGNVACVGVATGLYSQVELTSAGADAVLADLTATDAVVGVLRTVRRK